MSRFLVLNFQDNGLNQDIMETIQSHTLFCICCLERNVDFINITRCSHSDYLYNFTRPELKPINEVICHTCHQMLKKIKQFKLQVEQSFNLLTTQALNIETADKVKPSFEFVKVVDINIPSENTNPREADSNATVPPDKATEPQTTVNKKQNEKTKMKNIKEALNIIDNNASVKLFTDVEMLLDKEEAAITEYMENLIGNKEADIMESEEILVKNEEAAIMESEETLVKNEEAAISESEETLVKDEEADIIESVETIVKNEEATIMESVEALVKVEEAAIKESVETFVENEEATIIESEETLVKIEDAIITESEETFVEKKEASVMEPVACFAKTEDPELPVVVKIEGNTSMEEQGAKDNAQADQISDNDGMNQSELYAKPSTSRSNRRQSTVNSVSMTSDPLLTKANINPRKRKGNPENWSREQKKNKGNTGQKPQKQMRDPCNCKLRCFEKIPRDKRLEIFEKFWATGNHEAQWQFILKNTERVEPKVMKVQRKRARYRTVVYYLPFKDNTSLSQLKVCKTMFLNTLDITERIVYTAINKCAKGDEIIDHRGKHTNRPHKTASETEKSVIQHIQSFPCIEPHYLRKNTSRQYLSEDLNNSKMHRLYKDWMSENDVRNTKVASEYQYKEVFNTNFNLSFFRPKKDLCNICSKYDNETEDGKLQLKDNYESHIKNENTIRDIKNNEIEQADASVKTVAIFDLQKVLSLPQSNVGVFHYKRKYAAYNFTIYNLVSRQGFCYLWHAQIAKSGANEIASCLYHFIKSEVSRGIKSVSLLSDNCSNNNKNRVIFSMYIYVSRFFNVEIQHRFLQTGHTQNECDSMHACIEKNMKNKTLYSPDHLYEVITNTKTQKRLIIKEMTQNDFYNFKNQVTNNWSHDTNGDKVLFSQIKEIKTSPSAPNKLFYKYDLESSVYFVLDTMNYTSTRTRKTSKENHVDSDELPRLYTQILPISNALYKDLIYLCDTNAIPPHYQAFYRNLQPTAESTNLEVFESSDEE